MVVRWLLFTIDQEDIVPWTKFWDMHSGGGSKEPYELIFIEAPEDEAKSVFYARFGHNPERVSCTCCGEDYSISEYSTLEGATAYHRGCRYDSDAGTYVEEPDDSLVQYGGPLRTHITLEDYLARKEVLVIRAEDIADHERTTDVPVEGYVWV